jgi:hypothetical protein
MKQHDDSRPGSFSSGGQRIDDHSFWAGSKGKASVFPDGPHKEKMESTANGAGSLSRYQDTTEEIKKSQNHAQSKIKGRPLADNDRN